MQLPLAPERRRLRVDRREAASILQCSRDNIRRLDKAKQLKTGQQDRNGTFTYDRREIEELARKRGLSVKPSGELAARVFAMFKARRSFEDIVIETQQEPGVIRELRKEYDAGFTVEAEDARADDDEREQAAHDAKMREIDREFERRRRVG
jgi:hypothetical protein